MAKTMEKSMTRLILIVMTGLFASASPVLAEGLKITEINQEYRLLRISAKRVKGVEIKLTKEFIKKDCNTVTLGLKATRVYGEGTGWFDRYFIDGGMTATEIYCPIDPVKVKISSQAFFVPAFSNQHIDGQVEITVVVPKGFELEVSEVK